MDQIAKLVDLIFDHPKAEELLKFLSDITNLTESIEKSLESLSKENRILLVNKIKSYDNETTTI